MDNDTIVQFKKFKKIKQHLILNSMLKKDIISELRRYTIIADNLIEKYNILTYADCTLVMNLLQNKIDELSLLQEYKKIREELEI